MKSPPLTVFGDDHDGKTISQMYDCMKFGNAVSGVLCADGHLGYAQPVGGVIAYDNQISVSGVGFDIACGNLAVKTDIPFSVIADQRDEIADAIMKHISFGVGRVNNEKVSHPIFDQVPRWRAGGVLDMRDKAVAQLGTVGSGNHYVDIMVETSFLDEPEFGGSIYDCPVWIGIHFGSRGFGHGAATRYLKLAGGKDGMNVAPTILDLDTEIGTRYLIAMQLAGDYAYAGREWVASRVLKILGAQSVEEIHNHHNFAWEEEHDGKKLWVVRKGATPAFPGQKGFVGGSMGDDAVILEGIEGEASQRALYSTVHGAGRLFSRSRAKAEFSMEQMSAWLKERNVVLRGGGLDESPMAYRRLSEVLQFHGTTIEVKNVLRPVIVAMAGKVFDPYKD
jgi:tRNA-splicing ligase RtcB